MVIVNLGTVSFELDKAHIFPNGQADKEGELARLYLELLPKPSVTRKNARNEDVTFPAKRGIDLSNATFTEMKNYLNDDTIKKSESIKELVRKVMSLRFSTEFKDEIKNVSRKIKTKYKIITADTRKNIEFLGECGFKQR